LDGERDRNLDLDQQGEEELDEAFREHLANSERIFKEAEERAAKGEPQRNVMVGIDHKNRQIAIVPVDPPAPGAF